MTLRHYRLAVVVGAVLCLSSPPLGAQAIGAQAIDAPPLTAANLTRLRLLAESAGAAGPFPADLARLFGLGSEPILGRQLMSAWRGGEIYLAFLETPGGGVVLSVKDVTRIAIYLTDATRALRMAAVVDGSGTRLIANDQASTAFRLTLRRWNELAVEAAAAPN